MDTPVYKLYLAKFTMDVIQAPAEQKAEAAQKQEQFMKDTGGRALIAGTVISDERFRSFGVEWFPSWKALAEYNRCLDEIGWFQYIQSETFLGVENEQSPIDLTPPTLQPGTEYLAHIYLAHNQPALYDMSDAEMAQAMAFMEHEKELGAVTLFNVYSLPMNESWNWWGVQLFPSLETLVQKTVEQEKVKWWKYVQARTYLGVPDSGELIKK